MPSTTGTFHFFPGRSCALRREHPGCGDPSRTKHLYETRNDMRMNKRCRRLPKSFAHPEDDPARNRPDGRLKIFQSEVQRAELAYHTDYIYELTDRFFICPGFPLHSTRHLPGYGSFPGVFLPRKTQ
jgi:hypothetical protein